MATARGRRVAAHPHREDETGYGLDDAITAYVGDQQIEVAAESHATLTKNVPPGPDRAWRAGATPHHAGA